MRALIDQFTLADYKKEGLRLLLEEDYASLYDFVGEIRKNSSAEFCPSIWTPGSSPQFLSMKTPALFLARDGEDFAYIEAKEGREVKSAIMNQYPVNIPFRSRLVSPRAAELANGRLTVALTPYGLTERPAVLCRDSLIQYDINGYLTGVQTILKEK